MRGKGWWEYNSSVLVVSIIDIRQKSIHKKIIIWYDTSDKYNNLQRVVYAVALEV